MLRRYCDFCDKELKFIDDDRTSKTEWYKITNESKHTETDICNECLTKIVKALNHET